MFENDDILLLDLIPKSPHHGSHDYYSVNENSFDFCDSFYSNDEVTSSSLSPLSFDSLEDFSEYNEALLTKLIEEFNQEPFPNPDYFNDIINKNADHLSVIDTDRALPQYAHNTRKRKYLPLEHDPFYEDIEISVKRPVYEEPAHIEKRTNNSNAAFRYRQKQKVNKSKAEEDLNKSAIDMVNAKTEMLEMRKKLNTVKNIVKDLLRDKGFINHHPI